MSSKTRKLIWSAPLVAVLAVAGALAILVALAPNEAQAHEATMHGPPASVTMVDAEAAADDPNTPEVEGRTAISVMWKVPDMTGENSRDMATHYRIDRSTDTRVWENLEPSLADADVACDSSMGADYRCHTDTDLKPDTPYQYRVFAMNALGISPVSVDDTYGEATTEPVGAPTAVRNLRATINQEKQIDLSWDSPADNGGADIFLYCIVVATPSGTLTDLSTGNDVACKAENMTTPASGIEDLTEGLQVNLGATIAAATDTSEGVIVIEATDDDDMPVTSFMHTELEDPDVIRLMYRVYAVNSADGKLVTTDNREISASVTNTATRADGCGCSRSGQGVQKARRAAESTGSGAH